MTRVHLGRRTRRRPWFPLLILAGGVGYGAWHFSVSSDPERGTSSDLTESTAPSDDSSPSSGNTYAGRVAAGGDTNVPFWQQDVSHVFELRQDTGVRYDAGGSVVSYALAGSLEIARMADGYARLAFTGVLSRFAAGQQTDADPAVRSSLETELQRPIFAKLPLSGESLLVVAPGVSPFVIQNWKSLLENLRFTSGPSSASSWRATETGPLGSCEFEYGAQDGGAITKRSSRCTPKGDAAQQVSYAELDLDRTFTFGDSARLSTLRVEERVHLAPSSMVPGILSEHRVTLDGSERRPLSPEELARYRAEREAGSDADEATAIAQQTAFDRSRVGGRTFKGVMSTLMTLQNKLSDPASREKYEREYVALTALLRLEPEQHLGQIKEHIATNGPLQTVLIAALQDSGTEAAHGALAELMRADLNRDAKMELTRALSLTATPSPTSVAALRALKSDPTYGPQAVYGLGSSAHKLKQSNPELSGELSKELVDELDRSTSPDDQLIRLVALGSAGAEDALASIERSMRSPNENIRAAAAQALRRISGSRAQELLLVLGRDAEPTVRTSVIDVLSEREPTPESIELLAALCLSDPITRVRALAVQLAARWLSQVPALAATLTKVSTDAENEDVRNMARSALVRTGSSG